jgi:hypothetical protein
LRPRLCTQCSVVPTLPTALCSHCLIKPPRFMWDKPANTSSLTCSPRVALLSLQRGTGGVKSRHPLMCGSHATREYVRWHLQVKYHAAWRAQLHGAGLCPVPRGRRPIGAHPPRVITCSLLNTSGWPSEGTQQAPKVKTEKQAGVSVARGKAGMSVCEGLAHSASVHRLRPCRAAAPRKRRLQGRQERG